MTLKKAYPVLAIVLGAVGGVLHGLDLVQGYDSADLPTGAPWLTMLYVLSAIAVVLCVAAAFTYRKTSDRYKAFESYLTGGGTRHKTVAVLSGELFIVFGLAGLYYTMTHIMEMTMFDRVTLIPLYLLAIVSCVAFMRLGGSAVRGTVTEDDANMIFIPIAWAALDLVNTFKENGNVTWKASLCSNCWQPAACCAHCTHTQDFCSLPLARACSPDLPESVRFSA